MIAKESQKELYMQKEVQPMASLKLPMMLLNIQKLKFLIRLGKLLQFLLDSPQWRDKKDQLTHKEILEVNLKSIKGFAIKFYTEEGNWDMTGNNTPVFFIRDPIKFPDFIHSQKKDPRTHLKNPTAAWDFWGLVPESTHQVTILMSDRGTPDGFRHMHGYSSHTFRWINK